MTCLVTAVACDGCPPRNCDGDCGDLCRMIADLIAGNSGHEAWHRAAVCADCGAPKDGPDGFRAVFKPCPYGRCSRYHCPDCDAEWMSIGPVDCRCSSTWVTRMWLRWWRFTDRLRTKAGRP